jgi:hypothetical protein
MKALQFLICLSLFFSCQDKNITIPEDKICCWTSQIDATMNGNSWNNSDLTLKGYIIDTTRLTNYSPGKNNFSCIIPNGASIEIASYDKSKFQIHSLAILGLKRKVAKYGLINDMVNPNCIHGDSVNVFFVNIDDGDVSRDYYQAKVKNYNSYLEITAYDSITNGFKGIFDVALLVTFKRSLSAPDTLYLKGAFNIAGRQKK